MIQNHWENHEYILIQTDTHIICISWSVDVFQSGIYQPGVLHCNRAWNGWNRLPATFCSPGYPVATGRSIILKRWNKHGLPSWKALTIMQGRIKSLKQTCLIEPYIQIHWEKSCKTYFLCIVNDIYPLPLCLVFLNQQMVPTTHQLRSITLGK